MKRQRGKVPNEPETKKERILIFDIIRILCIAIIVYDHSRFMPISEINQLLFPDGMGPFNIYSAGLQGYAVFGMILVSGAVIEYNYQGIEKLTGYFQFLFRRFIRLYPAFWMSLVLGLIFFFPMLITETSPGNLLFEFTGFFIVLGQGGGYINIMGWFIATIVFLYLLFPWFSAALRKYGIWALFGFWIMSWGLRYSILTYHIMPGNQFWIWFPPCNAFEFCLGIYLIQTGFYPKKPTTSPVIRELSELCYYIFIFHVVVLSIMLTYVFPVIGAYDTAGSKNPFISYTFFYSLLIAAILAVSWIAMKIDIRIRSWIMNRNRVKAFLERS